jgi:Tn3 transposase DDE domain
VPATATAIANFPQGTRRSKQKGLFPGRGISRRFYLSDADLHRRIQAVTNKRELFNNFA